MASTKLDAAEDAAAQAFLGDVAEPSFDQVQPRTAGRDEVNVEARMALEPTPDLGMFMGRIIVHDQMQVQSRGRLRRRSLQEPDPLLMTMPLHALTDDDSFGDVERGEQGGGAVSLVVMRQRPAPARDKSAGWAGCDRAPGSGFSRRTTARAHAPADRGTSRPRRSLSRRNAGRWRP